MTNKMVQITVEILDILAIATKEMNQNLASEFNLRPTLLNADIGSEKFVKRVIGQTKLEDGMRKLDKLTNEEVAMASAQLLRVTHNIDNTVMRVDENVLVVKSDVERVNENVNAVDENVKAVDQNVKAVDENVKTVGDKVQTLANGRQRQFSESSAPSLIFII